jgi:demethylmacrocin O-methyltransferase
LKRKLSASQRRKLRNFIADICSIFYKSEQTTLAKLYGTDKSGIHSYTEHYSKHLTLLKNKKLNLLEIGVGGYDNPDAGGSSLKMWKKYFRRGNIFSIDIYDKSRLQEKRIKIFKGSQIDIGFLNNVVAEIGQIDIIIDDGSHINQHVIESFKFLFPKLKGGGIYVIEDTQTSYWEEYGGDSNNLQNSLTMMNFFKSLTDGLNYKEFRGSDYEVSYYDTNISSIHFYHNMIFIYKNQCK